MQPLDHVKTLMNVETNPVLMDTAEIPLEVLPAFVHLILLNIETLRILFVLVSRSDYIAVMLYCIYVPAYNSSYTQGSCIFIVKGL